MNHCCDYINLSSSSTLHPDGEKRGREKRKKKTEYKVREIEGGQGRERNRVEKIEGGREKLFRIIIGKNRLEFCKTYKRNQAIDSNITINPRHNKCNGIHPGTSS